MAIKRIRRNAVEMESIMEYWIKPHVVINYQTARKIGTKRNQKYDLQ